MPGASPSDDMIRSEISSEIVGCIESATWSSGSGVCERLHTMIASWALEWNAGSDRIEVVKN